MKEIRTKVARFAQLFKSIIMENWQSGMPGKIFLVVSALIMAWLILPLFCEGGGTSPSHTVENVAKSSCGGNTPTDVIKLYYRAFLDGDVTQFVNCVNYNDELKEKITTNLSESFHNDEWRETVGKLYGEIVCGVPQCTDNNKMSLRVFIANRRFGGGVDKTWYFVKVDGRWFIDSEMTTNPLEMGL